MQLPIPNQYFYDPDAPGLYPELRVVEILNNIFGDEYGFTKESIVDCCNQAGIAFSVEVTRVLDGDKVVISSMLINRNLSRSLSRNDFQKLIDFIKIGDYQVPCAQSTSLLHKRDEQDKWGRKWLNLNILNWEDRTLDYNELGLFKVAASKKGLEGKTFIRMRSRIGAKGEDKAK